METIIHLEDLLSDECIDQMLSVWFNRTYRRSKKDTNPEYMRKALLAAINFKKDT